MRRWTLRGQCVRRSRRSEEHTSELQSRSDLVCRLLLEKKKTRLHEPEQTNDRATLSAIRTHRTQRTTTENANDQTRIRAAPNYRHQRAYQRALQPREG